MVQMTNLDREVGRFEEIPHIAAMKLFQKSRRAHPAVNTLAMLLQTPRQAWVGKIDSLVDSPPF